MRRILCAIDASERAPQVIGAAVDLAKRTGARLVLFRAVTIPPELPLDLYMGTQAKMTDLLFDVAKKDLSAFAAKVPADMLQTTHVDIGSPWDAICRAGQKFEVDLIMVGSHGYSGLDRVLGTTAAKVVNHADRCVLVVRGDSPFG